MEKEHSGVIYILTNPSFPDYVKIGYADNIEQRLRQLNNSECIPFAFRAYAMYEVRDRLTDKVLHGLIDNLNPDLRSLDSFDGKKRVREFYAMSAEEAYNLLDAIAKISGTTDRLKKLTPEGHEQEDEKIAREISEVTRRKNFNFAEYGIQPGAELVFIEDERIRPVVVDDRRITYAGETTSVSALAQKLKGLTHPIQGTLYFTYNGEILTDLRSRKEKEAEQKEAE